MFVSSIKSDMSTKQFCKNYLPCWHHVHWSVTRDTMETLDQLSETESMENKTLQLILVKFTFAKLTEKGTNAILVAV